jgi:hypothetical protein
MSMRFRQRIGFLGGLAFSAFALVAFVGFVAVADAAKLPKNSVGSKQIKKNAVKKKHIKDLAVTTDKVADAAITTGKLADAAVTTDKLADAAVTTEKIADAAVDSAKIADAAITQDDLAANSVGNAQLQTKVYFAKVQYNAANPVILAGSPGVTSQGEGALGFPRIGFPQSMDNCAITATTSSAAGTSIVRHSSNSAGGTVQLAIQDGANAATRQNFSITGVC